MQAFMVALAMEILKYYGPKLGEAAMKVIELEKALAENKRKAGDYQKTVDSLLVLFLSTGCLKMAEAPITHLYIIDTQNSICSQRVITDKNSLSSKWVADLPLESCDGNVSLTMEEYLNLRTFLRGK